MISMRFKQFLIKELLDKTILTNSAVRAVSNTPAIYRPKKIGIADIQDSQVVLEAIFDSGEKRYFRIKISEIMNPQ